MPAQLRFDQVTPGAGTANRSRHDLVSGEIITCVATSPAPGAGITFSWEILDKRGSVAVLSALTGQSVTIGPNSEITQPCAFFVELTVNDNGVITKTRRICSVRSALAGLRPALFAETAPNAQTFNLNDPDLSVDNALYPNRSGTGVAEQNAFGWSEWAWELMMAIETASGSGPPSGAATGDLSLNYPNPRVSGLYSVAIDAQAAAPSAGQALIFDGTNYKPGNVIVDADFAGTFAGDLTRTGSSAYAARKHNVSAFAIPTNTDDSAQGYTVGSLWGFSGASVWFLIDPKANSAVWGRVVTAAEAAYLALLEVLGPEASGSTASVNQNAIAGTRSLPNISSPAGEPATADDPYYLEITDGVNSEHVTVIGRGGVVRALAGPLVNTYLAGPSSVAYAGLATTTPAGALSSLQFHRLLHIPLDAQSEAEVDAAAAAAVAAAAAYTDSVATGLVPNARTIAGTLPVRINGAASDNLGANMTVSVNDATDAARGTVELATIPETLLGLDTVRAVVPAGLRAYCPFFVFKDSGSEGDTLEVGVFYAVDPSGAGDGDCNFLLPAMTGDGEIYIKKYVTGAVTETISVTADGTNEMEGGVGATMILPDSDSVADPKPAWTLRFVASEGIWLVC